MRNIVYISDAAKSRLMAMANGNDENLSDVAERIIMLAPLPTQNVVLADDVSALKEKLAAISPKLAQTITGRHYGDGMSYDYKHELGEARKEKCQ